MATTSLWHIKGRLKDLIRYVENPEKTIPKGLEDFNNVLSYVKRDAATGNGAYIMGINCIPDIAFRQMLMTKQQFGKEDGYIAWHGYQSFKLGEVSPEKCHEIGIQTAKELWGDRYQIIVTTHLDKDHLHNHFCFNSVSFLDGKKYNYSKQERKRIMDISDRICKEHGLSVIERPGKAPPRSIWLDEKEGKPTRYNVFREDVRDAINGNRTPTYMEQYLIRKGYVTDFTGPQWRIRLPQQKHFVKLTTLDARWTPDTIRRTMGAHTRFGNKVPVVAYPPHMPRELKDWFQPFQKTSHIRRLYLYYCYMLGKLPKNTDYRPTSPYLKEDLRRLKEFAEQSQYMANHGIETLSDLLVDREQVQREMDELCDVRRRLQNKIRRATPEQKITLREEKAKITAQITILRKRLNVNKGIKERSIRIQLTMDLVYANEYRAKGKMPQIKEREERRR